MIKPTKDNVLVRVIEEKKKKDESPMAGTMTADVLAVGGKVQEIATNDKVLFAPYGFDEVTVDGEKLIIIDENLILGVIK